MSKLAGALPSARPRVSQGTASQQMLLSENALKACASFGYVFIEGEAECRLTRELAGEIVNFVEFESALFTTLL